jgi:hypothetical protein
MMIFDHPLAFRSLLSRGRRVNYPQPMIRRDDEQQSAVGRPRRASVAEDLDIAIAGSHGHGPLSAGGEVEQSEPRPVLAPEETQ